MADFDLTTSISLARVQSPMSHNTSVSVCQLTGFFPLPVAHSWRISLLIRSASSLCLSSMFRTLVPLRSSSRRRPKSWYLVLIFSAMLIIPSLPWNLMHSSKVGQSVVTMNTLSDNQVEKWKFRPIDLQGKNEEIYIPSSPPKVSSSTTLTSSVGAWSPNQWRCDHTLCLVHYAKQMFNT